MEDWSANRRFARYRSFRLGNEADKFRLYHQNLYYGNAGDSLHSHNGLPFSTFDVDNDNRDGDFVERSCSRLYKVIIKKVPQWNPLATFLIPLNSFSFILFNIFAVCFLRKAIHLEKCNSSRDSKHVHSIKNINFLARNTSKFKLVGWRSNQIKKCFASITNRINENYRILDGKNAYNT